VPAQSIWMIRSSLICLVAASVAGGLILVNNSADLHPAIWSLLPLHYEFAIWGWLVQFVMGTAYWMFPRFLSTPNRGNTEAAWTMVVLLNGGLLILAVSGWMQGGDFMAGTGRALIALSVVTFVLLMWKRAVSYRGRERKY
jgi:hypothetical protein